MHKLKRAIANRYLCHFYNKTESFTFTPLSLETSKFNEQNIIIGVDETNEKFCALPLANVQKIVIDDSAHIDIDDEDYDTIQDFFAEYDEAEEEVCSE